MTKYCAELSLCITLLVHAAAAQDTVQVYEGWNIIASFRSGPPPTVLYSAPPGIIIANLFQYLPDEGYGTADSLSRGTGYWVKVNADGLIIFNPSPLDLCGREPISHGGASYHTVRIGNQCWFKENLDVGEMINSLQNASNNGVIEKYCYNNDVSNCLAYGGLYQWNESMQYDSTVGARGICPPDWHVATNDDYQILLSNIHWETNALKAVGQGSGNGEGTNTSGFSALLAGRRDTSGYFSYLTGSATFWKSNKGEFADAGYLHLYGNGGYSEGGRDRNFGFSVRCLHD